MPYNLTTMQSIYHGQDEIELITYNNSPVYQKSGPVQNYDIRYTTTNNQKLTLADESDVAQHEFSSGVGYILLNANTPVPYQFFYNCTTLATVRYEDGVTFDSQGYQHDGCTSLISVTLPSDLTVVPTYCFKECYSLNSITLPSTVSAIYDYAFYECGHNNHNTGYYQPDVKFTSATVPTASSVNAFMTETAVSVTAYNTIYKLVPYESYPDYCVAQYWKVTNNYIDWYDDDNTDYESMPFYVENNTQNVETVTLSKISSDGDNGWLSQSSDRINWTTVGYLPDDVSNIAITLNPGQRIYLKCQAWFCYRIEGADTIGGNITSLCAIEPVNGIMPKTTAVHKCGAMFRKTSGKQGVVDARNLVTRYVDYGLSGVEFAATFSTLFGEHQGPVDPDRDLVYAPKYMYLHENAGREYMGTFAYCSSLTHTPKFIGSTASGSCFWKCFLGCTSLVAITPIPSITAIVSASETNELFNNIFYNCTHLNFIKNKTNTSLFDSNIRDNMTFNIGQNGCYVKNINDTLPTGSSGIPSSWTRLDATE